MRQRAQAAGNLQSTPQEAVNYDQGNIELAPANPQVVYVPAYNPWAVYGQPVSPLSRVLSAGGTGILFRFIAGMFGLGIAMTAFSRTPFGLLAWGLSWLAQSVLFNHSSYYSHSTTVADWGFPHGGRWAYSQHGFNQARGGYNAGYGQGFARGPQGYASNRPGEGRGYPTPGAGYARPVQQAYNRMQPSINTAPYARPAYGSSFNGGYGNRPGAYYGNSQQAYRAPAANFQSHQFADRSSGIYGGKGFNGFSSKPPHSDGGFHLFGGGHSEKSFGGGGKGFGGGHSSGGGHGFGKHHH